MPKIEIVGLGAGDFNQLPIGVYQKIKNHANLILRTKEHPLVSELVSKGINFRSFDEIYEQESQFESVYEKISEQLLKEAEKQDILYAVPGHPLVAEDSVQLLLKNQQGIEVEVLGGKSFIDDFFQAVSVDPIGGFQLVDGLSFDANQIDLGSHLIIMQVYNDLVAGDVKLTLMDKYPDEHQVALVDAAGTTFEKVTWVPLYELDHLEGIHNLLSVYVPPLERDDQTKSFATTQFYMDAIMNGDMWVQEQTHESLLAYLAEETEEVAEAIKKDDTENLIEELGDVLLQVFYHAGYAKSQGMFTMEDILDTLNKKLRRRHPHIFDGYEVNSIQEIDDMWQEIKRKEREEES